MLYTESKNLKRELIIADVIRRENYLSTEKLDLHKAAKEHSEVFTFFKSLIYFLFIGCRTFM